jgi:NAD(P)-dependent dehydrogenase (short-subunit alcohol dehydrogenase family)
VRKSLTDRTFRTKLAGWGVNGLPRPPAVGATALPPGAYDGAALVVASRKEEHRAAGVAALAEIGAEALGVELDIRSEESVAACFDAASAWRGLPRVELGRRHIAVGTPASIVNVGASYAWTGGPGFAHSAAAKAGVKNLTETLGVEWGPYGIQVIGLFPHEDMTADIQGNLGALDDKDGRQPALRVGQRHETGWAATSLASPDARFVSGHTLVVDGANWQRRSMTNPEVRPRPRPDGAGTLRPRGQTAMMSR